MIKTREEWLVKATSALRPLFSKHGAPIPKKVQVGCGCPRGGKTEIIGQCFGKTWTEDGTTHVFISPTQGDPVSVLAVLVHELIHAAVGCEEGHRGKFAKMARELGLEGKLTATYVSKNSGLHPKLVKITAGLGKYPHSKMTARRRVHAKDRYVWPRLISRTIPHYTFVMSPKLILAHGLPKDPVGQEMKIVGRK